MPHHWILVHTLCLHVYIHGNIDFWPGVSLCVPRLACGHAVYAPYILYMDIVGSGFWIIKKKLYLKLIKTVDPFRNEPHFSKYLRTTLWGYFSTIKFTPKIFYQFNPFTHPPTYNNSWLSSKWCIYIWLRHHLCIPFTFMTLWWQTSWPLSTQDFPWPSFPRVQ